VLRVLRVLQELQEPRVQQVSLFGQVLRAQQVLRVHKV
jgi:hypothetical protein